MNYTGTPGNDSYNGTSGNDHFNMKQGGADTVGGAGGDDIVSFGATFDSSDRVDGSTGNDTVVLDGAYTGGIAMSATVFNSVETLILRGSALGITMFDGNVAAHQVMTVRANQIAVRPPSEYTFHFDARAETNGSYHYLGGSGADEVDANAGFTAHWHVDGGAGFNLLELNADITARFSARTMTNIKQLDLAGAHNYHIVENDGNVASGQALVVGLQATSGFIDYFNGSAETDGSFEYSMGGSGTVQLQGGAGDDSFGGAMRAEDRLDGGAGNDILYWVLGTTVLQLTNQLKNIDEIQFAPDNYYGVVTGGHIADPGKTLVVDASLVRSDFFVNFNDAADHSGALHFINGKNTATVIGTNHSDDLDFTLGGSGTITGGRGADTIEANSANTYTFVYTAVADSTGTQHDTIGGVNLAHNTFQTQTQVIGVDAAVTAGTLSTGSFDADLAAAVGSGQMAAHHAMLFTANAGTLSGHTFLVVDQNGEAGYQTHEDLVVDVTGATGTLTLANFGWM